jgi:DNA-binding MarR family transcriptional regulator
MTQDCNNSMLRRASRMLGQLYDDELAPSGLRATQHGLLAQIHIMGAPTLRDLAAEIVMDLSALGHTLKPLVRDGYVTLVPDKEDRRVKHATLTSAGQKKLQQTMRLWAKAQQRFEKVFGDKKAASLRAVLGELSSETFRKVYKG